MIGSTVSHYKILEKLGEGGMGVVYKAEDTKLKRLVAVKFLPKRLSVHGEERERFTFEAQAASALNHPNICTIYEIDEENDETFMVMEFIDGMTLREWIRRKAEAPEGYRKIGVRESVDLATQIAEGLEKAHEKGIIHRDIKSENIMVTEDLRAKIMDFGLAKLRGVSKLTKTGSTIGTVAYMSPEQVEGAETDNRTDIFSYGVVMYELLAGQLPFRAAHETAMMYEIINVEPKSLAEVRSSIEAELSRIVMKCLEKNRDERYQSMREVAVDLKRFRRDSTGKLTERPSVVRERTPAAEIKGRGSSPKPFMVAGAALLLLAAASWFFFSARGTIKLDSLAVLPFTNVSPEADKEYLTEGITENIINKVSGFSHMRVVPRSLVNKYKGKEVDPREAGKELNVSAVLTGKVTQRGDQLIVQAELIDVQNVSQIWGEQYDGKLGDLLTVQEDIVRKLAEKLQVEPAKEEKSTLTTRHTTTPEAYQLYLKGRYFWNKRTDDDVRKAFGYFQQAIDIDPLYAGGYAGIASCYAVGNPWNYQPKELVPRMKAAATKALELDDALAEAHATLAISKCYYEFDFIDGERELRRAIALDPNYPTAHHWLGEFLVFMGRFDEGFAEYKKALELDPLSLAIASDYGRSLFLARQYDRSIEQLKKTIDMDPNFVRSHFYLVDPYLQKGLPDSAFQEIVSGLRAEGGSPKLIDTLKEIYKSGGMKGIAIFRVDRAAKDSTAFTPNVLAASYLVLGDRRNALRWLERTYEQRSNLIVMIKTDPFYDPLRSEPEFVALLKKVGFEK